MRTILLGTLTMVAAVAFSAAAQTVPQIACVSAPNLLTLPPNLCLGDVSGVAVNSTLPFGPNF